MARLHAHDSSSVELDLEVPFDQGRVDLDLWFFVPSQLGIDEPDFDREAFYRDRTAYVRFEPPRRELADAASLLEPIRALTARLGHAHATPDEEACAERTLRLFGACVREQLRIRRRRVERAPGEAERDAMIVALVADAEATLTAWRALRAQMPLPSARWATVLAAIDDFVSLQCVEVWFRLHEAHPHPGFAEAIRRETEERVAHGEHGPLNAEDDADNERFVTELNRLKKYVLSALHLRFVSTRVTDAAQDLAFGLAAAAAMTVAVVLQLVAVWTVGMPGPQEGASVAVFISFAVVSYILKDRLKDRLKAWFARRLPRWLYDRRVELRAEDGSAVYGHAEETVRVMHLGAVPPEVAALRAEAEHPVELVVRAADDVVHYRRGLALRTGVRDQCPEAEGVEQILRFNLSAWLRRMDDPTRVLYQLDDDGNARRIQGPKTYTIPVVVAIRRPTGTEVHRQTLVLARDGLVRVETVGGRRRG